MTDGMVLMPWWTPWLCGVLVIVCLAGTAWFDRYSKARLREATDYWRKSLAIWEKIDAVPASAMSAAALHDMDAFVSEHVDQSGSLPSDYVKPPSLV